MAWEIEGKKLIKSLLRPGETGGIFGKRGYGKTHLAILLIEGALKLDYEVLTNVIFVQKVSNTGDPIVDWIEENPKGVRRCESVYDMYYQSSKIHMEDRKKKIMVLIDELGESAHAYRTMSQMSFILCQSQGTMRKHHICQVYCNPSYWATPAELRRYMGWIIYKNAGKANKMAIKDGYKGIDPKKKYAFLIDSERMGEVIIRIPDDKLCKPEGRMKLGDISYDTFATAQFIEGPIWFSTPIKEGGAGGIEALRKVMGSHSHFRTAKDVVEWCETMEIEKANPQPHGNAKIDARQDFEDNYLEDMITKKITRYKVAEKLGVSNTTIGRWMNDYADAEESVNKYLEQKERNKKSNEDF